MKRYIKASEDFKQYSLLEIKEAIERFCAKEIDDRYPELQRINDVKVLENIYDDIVASLHYRVPESIEDFRLKIEFSFRPRMAENGKHVSYFHAVTYYKKNSGHMQEDWIGTIFPEYLNLYNMVDVNRLHRFISSELRKHGATSAFVIGVLVDDNLIGYLTKATEQIAHNLPQSYLDVTPYYNNGLENEHQSASVFAIGTIHDPSLNTTIKYYDSEKACARAIKTIIKNIDNFEGEYVEAYNDPESTSLNSGVIEVRKGVTSNDSRKYSGRIPVYGDFNNPNAWMNRISFDVYSYETE